MSRNLEVYFRSEHLVTDRVLRFQQHHLAGRPGYAIIDLVTFEYQPIEKLIAARAELVHGYQGETPHSLFGRIDAATIMAGTSTDATTSGFTYRIKLVSPIALLDRSIDSRIFQNLSTPEIIQAVLTGAGITGEEVSLALSTSYPKREFCVQYQESSLAFIQRLAEEEGIYFYTDCVLGEHARLVFADDSTSASTIADDAEVPFALRSHGIQDHDTLSTLSPKHQVRSGSFVSRDFNFITPQLEVTSKDLTQTATASRHTDLEVYDYPAGFLELKEGSTVGELTETTLKRLNQVRFEAEQALALTLTASSDSPRLRVGRQFTVIDSEGLDGSYFIFATRLSYEYARPSKDGPPADHYECESQLVPLLVKYRSPQTTPRPVIAGPQTAVVVAPEGSEAEEIHTDKHGRCQVKFRWDRDGNVASDASCWMRVQQLQTSGSMVLPRVHWEVIVEFLEGNPDRPLVTGRLYNGLFMPPYALPEGKTRTSLQTRSTPGGGGSNEIRYEDKAGGEEVMIHSQYDTQMVTANNKQKNIGNNESVFVTNNSSSEVAGNADTKITKGAQNDIGADQTVTVSGNRTRAVNAVYGLTSGGDTTVTVGGNQFEMTGNPLEAILAIAAERAAEYLAAAAANVVGQVTAAAQGAVDQVLAPVTALTAQVDEVVGNMTALAGGDLGSAAAVIAGATGLPGAGEIAGAIAGPPAAMTEVAGQSAADIAGVNAIRAAATSMIQQGAGSAMSAVNDALGRGGEGGGGQSAENVAGPKGDVDGVDEAKNTKGPGHQINSLSATHTETSAALRVLAAVNGINTNVTASMNQTVGAAHLELILGNRAESVEGIKNETSVGLIILSKGDETEHVGGAKNTMVGGAILQTIKGDYAVVASAPATLVGAIHKMDAKSSITFKAGASEVVLDGAGITITSPIFTCTLPKNHLPKKVNDS